jgi:hypothetical protein
MELSRRTFLAGGLAAGAGLLAGRHLLQADPAGAAAAASPPGDVVGKVTVGYQGWFAAPGDGAPINGWWHWSNNWSQPPSPANTAIAAWPDTRDYTRTYRSSYPNLGNGQPATLFSSYDQQTVDTHFGWMRANGIDTAALQRFNPNGGEGATRDAMAAKVRQAAEATGRKFYVMYDVTNWFAMQSEIKTDWTNKMRAHTASGAYARQNGKPVVGIWGFGFADDARPFSPAACLEVITWFQDQGCYVMGGVPTWWRRGDRDSRPGFAEVYHALDMLSPWMVGRIGTPDDSDRFYAEATVPDVAECAAYGVDYQPCVLPGDVQGRQRRHGDFMWRQFWNVVRAGSAGIYVSMFDEYNEGNQIAKTAESAAWVPAGLGLLGLDEDGTPCSSDYYLRLTGDGGRMLKGQLALTATRPTVPMPGTTPPPAATAVALRSRANGRLVCAENAGAAGLIANRDAIGLWERFDRVDLGGGKIALRAQVNGRYVTATATSLVADATTVGTAQTFTQVSGTAFLAAATGRYVCAENAGAAALVANRDAIGPWEQFDVVSV